MLWSWYTLMSSSFCGARHFVLCPHLSTPVHPSTLPGWWSECPSTWPPSLPIQPPCRWHSVWSSRPGPPYGALRPTTVGRKTKPPPSAPFLCGCVFCVQLSLHCRYSRVTLDQKRSKRVRKDWPGLPHVFGKSTWMKMLVEALAKSMVSASFCNTWRIHFFEQGKDTSALKDTSKVRIGLIKA